MNPKLTNNLNTLLANLTADPGVYRMIDAKGTVLYVGKAANLKKRVASYFNKQQAAVKTQSLVNQIANIEVTITRSETEALLLESNLIKSLRPKYNVLMRDDKSYPYIQVNSKHSFPRMELYRSKRKPKSGDFYGPYPSVSAVRETLSVIQKIFKIRNCSDSYFNARTRPCLQYQIKRCSAPCVNYISAEDYQRSVRDATRFLQGKCQQIIDELEGRMEEAALKLAFEEAAFLRDQIKSLRIVQEQQAVVQLRGDADVIAIEAQPGFACIQAVTIRHGEVLTSRSFFPAVPQIELIENMTELWSQVFHAFIGFYYVDMPERIPALIITHQDIVDRQALEQMLTELRGKPCQIQIKPRGAKARWLDLAENNLRLAVADYAVSITAMRLRYEALGQLLKRGTPIRRMECFDISHTLGEATVASCVVFDQNGPLKTEYRQFNIQNITAGDDYAAMEQVLYRRFKRLLQEKNLPDLLIIDGGKGQVAVAERLLKALDIHTVSLIGVAKGPERKAGWERLILVTENHEITLPADSPALHLLQHIRNEAHRFAITAHRNKRNKARFESTLEGIEGIGPKRRQALLRRFGGWRELAKAPLDEIAKVTGISRELAARVFHYFHPED